MLLSGRGAGRVPEKLSREEERASRFEALRQQIVTAFEEAANGVQYEDRQLAERYRTDGKLVAQVISLAVKALGDDRPRPVVFDFGPPG